MEIKRKLRGFVPLTTVNNKKSYNYTKYKFKQSYSCEDDNYLWILKPTFLNRGRGIHVFNNLDIFTKLIISYQEGCIE